MRHLNPEDGVLALPIQKLSHAGCGPDFALDDTYINPQACMSSVHPHRRLRSCQVAGTGDQTPLPDGGAV